MTLAPGESRYISYRHQYDNQYTSAANAYFQSSDPSICTVSSSGEVVAKSPGTTYINVYSKVSSVSPYCKVTVQQVEPSSVSLPSNITMTVGDTRILTPSLYPSNAQTSYSWTSSDSQIASVSSSGVVTAKKHGTVAITVRTSNGKSASCDVLVQKRKLNLKTSHTSGLVEEGTHIVLTSDVSDAKIYYTLDGSTPTSNSAVYNNSLPIHASAFVKAIAIHPDYLDSEILNLNFTTTSLALVSTSPDLSSTKSAPHLIPCIIFNSSVKDSENFNTIDFYAIKR